MNCFIVAYYVIIIYVIIIIIIGDKLSFVVNTMAAHSVK